MTTRSKKEDWIELLALKEESGKSVKDFCEELGFPEHPFYYWRKRLAEENNEPFIELKVDDSPTITAGVELDLTTWSIRLERDFDTPTLRQLLSVVRGV